MHELIVFRNFPNPRIFLIQLYKCLNWTQWLIHWFFEVIIIVIFSTVKGTEGFLVLLLIYAFIFQLDAVKSYCTVVFGSN
jgi:hypothetical protein